MLQMALQELGIRPRHPNPRIAALLREILGNPFRPARIASRWLTPDVVGLAAAIHEEKGYERMGILADALQDAGCDCAEVLDHCHGPGPHVLGCWVVDALLGKR
jgi:hypothetical protein